jgi:hypothetical protein
VHADLVVDATGRGSSSPRWLADPGYEVPQEQRLQVDVHYVTRLFRREPGDLGGCRHVLVDVPPDGRRGGVALAVEDDRWQVTLIGLLGEQPPTDLEAFTRYAASLWADDLHQIVDRATPLDDGVPRTFPAFSWKRYDQLDALPQGYLVAGDAVCSLDPRFGQGMTVALAEAIALGEVLDDHGLQDVGRRVLAASRRTVQDVWDLSAGADLAHTDVDGPRPLQWKLTTAYLQRLLPVAHRDPEVAAALIRVIAMLDRPQQQMHPRTLWRVLRGRQHRERESEATHATTGAERHSRAVRGRPPADRPAASRHTCEIRAEVTPTGRRYPVATTRNVPGRPSSQRLSNLLIAAGVSGWLRIASMSSSARHGPKE